MKLLLDTHVFLWFISRDALQIPPSKASFQALKDKGRTLGQQARGATPARLIETLPPALRGGANSQRAVSWGEPFAQVDTFVGHRGSRWARCRHAHKTGRGIPARSLPPRLGERGQFPDPATGAQRLGGHEAVKPQRSLKSRARPTPSTLPGRRTARPATATWRGRRRPRFGLRACDTKTGAARGVGR